LSSFVYILTAAAVVAVAIVYLAVKAVDEMDDADRIFDDDY